MPSLTTEAPVIDAAIRSIQPRSPLVGHGGAFYTAGERYGVDWRLLVGIGNAETSLATYGPSQAIHNPFGIGPHRNFASYDDAIMALAKLLAERYISKGRTSVGAIYPLYVNGDAKAKPEPASGWSRNVSAVMTKLGGSPNSLGTAQGTSIIGDAGDVAAAPLDGIVQLLARLFDPSLWLRVVAVLGGAAILILALVIMFRQAIPSALSRGLTPRRSAGG